MKLGCCLVIALCLGARANAQVGPVAPPSIAPPLAVVTWVKQHAVAVGSEASEPQGDEAAMLDRLAQGSRVIGMGESNHGNHEPLAYRNRVIQYLVEHDGLTAVALESGLAESRPLYRYVLGGPGDAEALVRTGLTHGFGRLRENLELVVWLRAWNAAHPAHPVHLYGIDRSTIQSGPPGQPGDGIVLDHVSAYLARTVPDASAEVRTRLAAFARRFTEVDYPAYSAADRIALDAALQDTMQLFQAQRAAMIRASSAEEYDWTAREALDAQHLPALFRTWVNDASNLDALIHLIELRDLAMADHVEWALRREGPRGKVLLFQANGHVVADTLVGSVMRAFSRQPKVSGMLLRERLGHAYRVLATISSRGRGADDPTLGSIDRAFAAAGPAPVMLDLAAPGRSAWWSQTQSASQGDRRVDDTVPARSFDMMLYFARLTPVVPLAVKSGT
jgi:erythromycin esterase